jgi:glycine betaine/proline transport system substrate-binding protein
MARRVQVGAAAVIAALAIGVPSDALAAADSPTGGDPPTCKKVRLADVGWTAETATTATFARIVTELGYETQTTVLSVPVTFEALKNGDMDVFLGNWIPAQTPMLKPYIEEKSIEVVRNNLTGAKYTLAVPGYLYEAGLRDFKDIARFRNELGSSIYGIEPGNDGNGIVLEMIKKNEYGLGAFKLIESSEQGMLAAVERAVRDKKPVVFLGWAPHPMNTHFDMRYLTGGDDTFGPNYGAATVRTLTRRNYSKECPNVGRLLANMEFNVALENEWMDEILSKQVRVTDLAQDWVAKRPELMQHWLEGVRALDGRPALKALAATGPVHAQSAFETYVMSRKIPVGDAMTRFVDFTKRDARGFFDAISLTMSGSIAAVDLLLRGLPAPVLIGGLALLAWVLRRSIGLSIFIVASLLFIMNQGYWEATLETLTLVLVAALIATLIGVPLGIAAAKRPRLYAAMRPVLDLMQTLPTFVYLTPTLVLFGLGVVPGLISTIIFALPAPIRLTQLGISSVPTTLREAGQAFGATPLQLLVKVELPSAAPTILAGITQCIMLSLSMVVIAALVGAGGLGVPVVRALNTVQVGMGFEAGIAIVLLAIILDRISRPAERNDHR